MKIMVSYIKSHLHESNDALICDKRLSPNRVHCHDSKLLRLWLAPCLFSLPDKHVARFQANFCQLGSSGYWKHAKEPERPFLVTCSGQKYLELQNSAGII